MAAKTRRVITCRRKLCSALAAQRLRESKKAPSRLKYYVQPLGADGEKSFPPLPTLPVASPGIPANVMATSGRRLMKRPSTAVGVPTLFIAESAVSRSVNRLADPRGTAPGPDCIPTEFFEALGPRCMRPCGLALGLRKEAARALLEAALEGPRITSAFRRRSDLFLVVMLLWLLAEKGIARCAAPSQCCRPTWRMRLAPSAKILSGHTGSQGHPTSQLASRNSVPGELVQGCRR